MPDTGVEAFDRAVHTTNEWMKDVMEEMGETDRDRAYSAFRGVLHALRDNLTLEESAHLGAQLPMLITGLYYQGWTPTGKPVRERHLDEFLDRVDQELRNMALVIDAETAARAVFRLLSKRVSEGEIEDVVSILPRDVKQLWPEAA